MANRQENGKKLAKPSQDFGSVINGKRDGLGELVDEGGRWERLIDEDNWEKIELLEDLEDDGQVDRLSDDESVPRVQSHPQNKLDRALPQEDELSPSAHDDHATASSTSESLIKDDLKGFSAMLDSLEIVERPPGQPFARKPVILEPPEEKSMERSHSRRLKKTEKEKTAGMEHSDEQTHVSDADSDDMDVLGELSMRSGGENGDDVASTILRSSRTLQRVSGDQEVGSAEAEAPLTEEEIKRYQEEDDLFAQAWQARDEEKAKGSWAD
jgi:hypothetical protein